MPANSSEEFDSQYLPDQLQHVAGTLDRMAVETARLKALAMEYAEALDVGCRNRQVSEDRMCDMKSEYEALQERYRVGQKSWHAMNARLAVAEANAAAFQASRSEIAYRIRELTTRAVSAEETALLLSDALCTML